MDYRILVVEDDAVISAAVAGHISSWGCQVRRAENFADIMSEFNEFEPQLVLLDISLPFYNGYHWCSEIRKVSRVPVIFISSASDNMNIVMAMNMGGDDFIAKPYDIPLRALICRDIDNLMRAGRCISGDRIAHASYRVTGNAVDMGFSAGKAAAKFISEGKTPHSLKNGG